MSRFALIIKKWVAFFFPRRGWKLQLRQYKAGMKTWEVPGKPDKPKVVPWPIDWIPHDFQLETEADEARGWRMLAATCVDSGKECEPGVGTCCVRCSVTLHPECANMIGPWDPPYCRRCAIFMS